MAKTLVVGSRASALAMTQTRMVISALAAAHPGLSCEIRNISTHGDRVLDRSLVEIGGKGVFVKEIEEALLARTIDLAVHSAKDLPTEQPAGLVIAAILAREDPRDALVAHGGLRLADLPRGARVGTSSLRRAIQLKALRPDLQTVDIRGNVDTRLRKLEAGEYDAIVLAAAGLTRLGLADQVSQFFDPDSFLPAPGQGALAVETRDDAATLAPVAALDDPSTRQAIEAERAFLRGLGGGCNVPMGAYASLKDDTLVVQGMLANEDGSDLVYAQIYGRAEQAGDLGQRLAEQILRRKRDRG